MARRHDRKRILITGAANGIGLATAERLAEEGARLYLVDAAVDLLNERAKALAEKTEVVARELSVTDEPAVRKATEDMVARFGGIDAVLNSAGIVVVEPALEASLETFRKVIDINLVGTWIVCQAVARHMAKAGSGSIVNVSSVYGFQGALSRTAYSASKGGVIALTDSLAVEWGPLGIRVNSIVPTGTRTPMVQDLIDRGIYKLEAVCKRTPLGRLAEPDEVARACSFLMSDDSSMTTGTHLRIDGGWLANGFPT
jgi:NAD(P)-dependent dehydrogenase (short-subunit alcohol dehydrogenase family)